MGDHSPLSSLHRDIGIPINFQEESGLSPFRNTDLRGPLELPIDLRPPVKMIWDIGFSLGTAQNIDIPLSCEKKNEPAFKLLQANLTFFRFRESRYPVHVTLQIPRPSHIPIADRRLLLRCCGNVAYLFNRILGISSPGDDMECMLLSSSSFLKLVFI